jgi:uncharacterized protein (TIGR02118 family)
MIKLVYCITKRPDLSDEEFFRYWKNIHAAIGAKIPRLRKLVQSHRINTPGDKHPPAYDGIPELWFDNIEDLLAARQSPNGKPQPTTKQTSSTAQKSPTSSPKSTWY